MRTISKTLAALLALVALTQLSLRAGGDWPQWRGPDRTDVSTETGLLKAWPAGGPKRVWLFEKAGHGYSGPAIVGGKLFTLGTRDGSEILLVLDAATGRELMTAKLGSIWDDDKGDGPRATPTVDGDRVYALSGPGHLVCVSVTDGKVLWQTTMDRLGGAAPQWGYSESVLVDGNRVLCTPGGWQGAVAALDKLTGKVLWQTKEFRDPAHYSSIVPATINGTAQYVQRTEKSIVGIGVNDGRVLWKADFMQGRTAVAPTPIVKDNEIYVTAGYGAGCKKVRVGPGNDTVTVFENKVMKNHHGGVILVGDYLYGHADPGWVCQNFKTGAEVWNDRKLGKGAVGYADGMLYCVDEGTGAVALVEASPSGWKEHGRFRLDPQSKIRASGGRIWTHPVVCNGRLYLRDQEFIYCFDVKAG